MPGKGKPFEPGNKLGRGRPRGSRNKTTLAARTLMESYAEPVVRRCLKGALEGDQKLIQICMDRLVPVFRELPVRIGKLPLNNLGEVSRASATVIQKVAAGQLTPSQGNLVAQIIEQHRKVLETEELEKRLRALEERQ
jgi:hypothetical protein